jgi:oligosaccharyltransferase complex subunit beta
MRLLSSALLTLLALTKLSFASSSSVLVVLDPSLNREDYSIFFGGLEGLS